MGDHHPRVVSVMENVVVVSVMENVVCGSLMVDYDKGEGDYGGECRI